MSELGETLIGEKELGPNKVLRMFHYVARTGCSRNAVDMMRIELRWNGVVTVPVRMERKIWEACKELD